MDRVSQYYPGYTVELTEADSQWITEPINALAYDNYVIGRTSLSEEAVYQVTKALYENNAELLAAGNATADWLDELYVSENVAIPYHPGAIKYYQEIGLWSSEMQAHQDELLASMR